MSTEDNGLGDPLAKALAVLLDTMDTLETIGRHMHPSSLSDLVRSIGDRDTLLRAERATCQSADLPRPLEHLRTPLLAAADLALRACDGLRAAADDPNAIPAAYRAMRDALRAQEALYPLAASEPRVGRFFLGARQRDDQELEVRLRDAPWQENTGPIHAANETSERGGFSLYIPEDYDPARQYPLIMALHGGSGHGRLFLWNWVREARSRGLIVVAPTSSDDTWSLMEPEIDAGLIAYILERVQEGWSIDRKRLLLTGMSDGGTFTLLTGLDSDSPFTHLAPVAASFHPLLVTMTEASRVVGLPIYLVHGALDWMFPVSVGRTANLALAATGAAVTYREVADLAHTYPRDENDRIIDWLLQPVREDA